MKKHSIKILFVAVLLIAGGFSFLGNTKSTVFAAAACIVNSDNTVVTVADGQCWGTHLCTNGVMGDPGSCTSGGGIAVVGGGSLTGGIFSLVYPNVIAWVNGNGSLVAPRAISTRDSFFDQNGTEIFLVGGDASKVAGLVNNLVAGKSISTGYQAGYPTNTCGGTTPTSLANPHCCGTIYATGTGGYVTAAPYSWGSGLCAAVTASGGPTTTQ